EIGDAADIVGRTERAEFDLNELRWREFELVLGLGGGVVTVALAEPADGVDGELLLTLKADAGAGGKSKNVLGFDLAPGACVVGGVASRDQATDTSVVHARACCDECRSIPGRSARR